MVEIQNMYWKGKREKGMYTVHHKAATGNTLKLIMETVQQDV